MHLMTICNNTTSHKLECLHTYEMMSTNDNTEYVHVTLPYSSFARLFKSIAMIGLAEISITHMSFDFL